MMLTNGGDNRDAVHPGVGEGPPRVDLVLLTWRVAILERLDKLFLEVLNLLDGHCCPILLVENIELVGLRPQLIYRTIAYVGNVHHGMGDGRLCQAEERNWAIRHRKEQIKYK